MTKRYFKDGTEATDEILNKMADEAEAAYDGPSELRPIGRPRLGAEPSSIVPVRMDPELRQAAANRAAMEQTTISDLMREALRRYLETTH